MQTTIALDLTGRTIAQAKRRVGHLLVGRLGFGDDLPIFLGIKQDVGLLHEQSALDETVSPGRTSLGQRAHLHQADVRFPLGFGGKDFQGLGLEVGGDHGFDEEARLGRALRHWLCRPAGSMPRIDPKALSGSPAMARRVASPRLSATAAPHGLLCFSTQTAGSSNCRAMLKALSRSKQVVVRKLLTVELLGRNRAGAGRMGVAIDGGLLVRILAVSQHGLARHTQRERAGENAFGRLAGEVGRDGRVVFGRVGKRLTGQTAPQFEIGAAVGLELFEDGRVLTRVGRNGREGMVLRGRSDQRRARRCRSSRWPPPW